MLLPIEGLEIDSRLLDDLLGGAFAHPDARGLLDVGQRFVKGPLNGVADQTFLPSYEGVEINGPGCGTCPAAAESLSLE